MSETYFISDTHLSHQNILKYEPIARPFATIEEMNEKLIDNWNKVVGKYDKVYHLGDFAFGKANIAIAGRLNGQKRLIMGNHDCYPMEEYLKYFLSIHGSIFLKDYLLTHIPAHPYQLVYRAKLNITGHLHSKYILDENGERDLRYFNACADANNLTPVHIDTIIQYSKGIENEEILYRADQGAKNIG